MLVKDISYTCILDIACGCGAEVTLVQSVKECQTNAFDEERGVNSSLINSMEVAERLFCMQAFAHHCVSAIFRKFAVRNT